MTNPSRDPLRRALRSPAPGAGSPAPDAGPGAGSGAAFSLLTWNVLADGLAGESFVKAPAACLDWADRGERILAAIHAAGGEHGWPELVCLQEVDHFADLIEPRLRAQGYCGAFVPKSEGRDGCCLLWQRARFALRWVRPLRYLGDGGENQTQVAVIAALDDNVAGAPLLVATTHLKAKAGHEATRAGQARQLVVALAAAAADLGPAAGVVVAGDFNDVPGSLAHRAMVGREDGLKSAYAALDDGHEPAWTTWKVRADGEVRRTIDYVFYRPDTLRLIAVLDVPNDADVDDARLPSWRYPSDHLSLYVRFDRSSR